MSSETAPVTQDAEGTVATHVVQPPKVIRLEVASSLFLERLQLLLTDEETKDFSLLCEGGHVIRAHKPVLFLFTDFFAHRGREVSIKGASPVALQALIQMLYLGILNVDEALVPQILSLAKLLKIKGDFHVGRNQDPMTKHSDSGTQTVPDSSHQDEEGKENLQGLDDSLERFPSFPKPKNGKTYSAKHPRANFEAIAREKEAEANRAPRADRPVISAEWPSCLESEDFEAKHLSPALAHEGGLQCGFCFKQFRLPGLLKRHERVHRQSHQESDAGFIPCEKCRRLFATPTWAELHGETCTGVGLEEIQDAEKPKHHVLQECRLCEAKLGNSIELVQHYNINHKDEKPFKCKNCDQTFDRQQTLMSHMISHKTRRDQVCVYCAKEFKCEKALNRHEKNHYKDRVPCRFCNKPISAHKLHAHEKTHVNRNKCQYCEKTFANENNLRVHERVHTGQRPFRCCFCDKTFFQLAHKQAHEAIHTGTKRYKCSFCGLPFMSKHSANLHERKVHTGEKPYNCSLCERTFFNQQNKKHHEAFQHNMHPQYRTLKILSTKKQSEMRDSSKATKTFKCSFCDKCFGSRANAVGHERTHTGERPFACATCGKAFALEGNLKAHMLSHSEDKKFPCPVCHKLFKFSGNLNRHQMVHTGSKPFKCSFCGKAFNQKQSMEAHEKTHRKYMN